MKHIQRNKTELDVKKLSIYSLFVFVSVACHVIQMCISFMRLFGHWIVGRMKFIFLPVPGSYLSHADSKLDFFFLPGNIFFCAIA